MFEKSNITIRKFLNKIVFHFICIFILNSCEWIMLKQIKMKLSRKFWKWNKLICDFMFCINHDKLLALIAIACTIAIYNIVDCWKKKWKYLKIHFHGIVESGKCSRKNGKHEKTINEMSCMKETKERLNLSSNLINTYLLQFSGIFWFKKNTIQKWERNKTWSHYLKL